jgi:hypothetical protein
MAAAYFMLGLAAWAVLTLLVLRLQPSQKPPPVAKEPIFVTLPREPLKLDSRTYCDFEIVGESFYQHNLRAIAGSMPVTGVVLHTTAVLVFDPDNRFDANAVMVMISGLQVGHLARAEATTYGERMRELGVAGRAAYCDALIVGGWVIQPGQRANLGVKLGLKWPVHVWTEARLFESAISNNDHMAHALLTQHGPILFALQGFDDDTAAALVKRAARLNFHRVDGTGLKPQVLCLRGILPSDEVLRLGESGTFVVSENGFRQLTTKRRTSMPET